MGEYIPIRHLKNGLKDLTVMFIVLDVGRANVTKVILPVFWPDSISKKLDLNFGPLVGRFSLLSLFYLCKYSRGATASCHSYIVKNFSYLDHWSEAMLSLVSSWIGDHLGNTKCCVSCRINTGIKLREFKAAWLGTMRSLAFSPWSDNGSIPTGAEQPDPHIFIQQRDIYIRRGSKF